MKKRLHYFCFFLSVLAFQVAAAQNGIEIRISSFEGGNTASIEDLLAYPTITLINKNSKGDTKLISYICDFSMSDKKNGPRKVTEIKNEGYRFNEETIRLINSFLPGDDFVIKDIMVEVTNDKKKNTEVKKLASITIKIAGKDENAPDNKVEYNGKLLTGNNHDVPVTNQKVILQNQLEKDLQSTITNNSGDFSFKNLDASESYKIKVAVDDKTKIKDDQLYAANPDGTVVKSFNKTKNGFVYELLPNELNILKRMKEEDTEIAIKKFGSSQQSILTVVEYIYYDPNSAEIKSGSIGKLDKIIIAMEENKSLKLVVTSHTDANGEDAYNMALSEKRALNVMQYFILQGIDKGRVVAKGLGETQLLNRCKNGVECSEAEHQQNRRTEFTFTK